MDYLIYFIHTHTCGPRLRTQLGVFTSWTPPSTHAHTITTPCQRIAPLLSPSTVLHHSSRLSSCAAGWPQQLSPWWPARITPNRETDVAPEEERGWGSVSEARWWRRRISSRVVSLMMRSSRGQEIRQTPPADTVTFDLYCPSPRSETLVYSQFPACVMLKCAEDSPKRVWFPLSVTCHPVWRRIITFTWFLWLIKKLM